MRRRGEADRNYIVVATHTVCIGSRMRKGRTKKRDRAGMTGLARKIRRNMIAGFAKSRNAIVTGGATTGYSGVVKFHPDRETCRARMAHLARRDRRDVGRRLPDRNRTVVAS